MKPYRLFPSFVIAAALALAFLAGSRAADDNTTTLKFSDPSKPGTLKVHAGRGDIRIKGAEVAEVIVKSDAKAITSKPRKDGLRVISASSAFSLAEKDNVITVESDAFRGGSSDFTITVPRSTKIVVNNMAWGGGDIRLTDIEGDIEVECPHGEVHLDRISGGAIVTTMNGEIYASLLKLTANKPLSFASMNGEVQLRLPAEAKANLLIRTQNGSILTDFEEGALITKAESTPRPGSKTTPPRGGRSVLSADVQEAIAEASRIAAEATKIAEQAAREAAEAMREGADRSRVAAKRAEAEAKRAEAEAKRAEARHAEERAAAPRAPDTPRAAAGAVPAAPPPPAPPPEPGRMLQSKIMPTGGNLVTGTLNGGGPEISIATMNGDVTLRKLDAK